MGDSKDWRDLEARFRALQPEQGEGLNADWLLGTLMIPNQDAPAGDHWSLSGASDPRTARVFTLLAERAVHYLGRCDGKSPLYFWLDLLKRNCANTKSIHRMKAPNKLWARGTIHRVCEVSADYCLELENQVLSEGEKTSDNPIKFPLSVGQHRKARNASNPRIGQNINSFRKECGWSYEDLAKATGLDKKSVLSHVNRGVQPHPKTMREYAQAFTKQLKRQVTIQELEQ